MPAGTGPPERASQNMPTYVQGPYEHPSLPLVDLMIYGSVKEEPCDSQKLRDLTSSFLRARVVGRESWAAGAGSHGTSGLVAMTSASHAEGRQFDPGLVYFSAGAPSMGCMC